MPLQGLARAAEPSRRRHSFSRSACASVSCKMGLEKPLELHRAGRFRHFRQRLGQLLFRVQDVAELIDQEAP